MEEEADYLLKIVIVGDSGTGKTNLLSRFTHNVFHEDTRNTIGVDFYPMDLTINNKKVKAQFWDTAGQEKYRAIASAYYKNAQGAILVYDITRKETFENLGAWLNELKQHADQNIDLMILGNKTDLYTQRKVLQEEGKRLAENTNAFFMEVSSKTNEELCVNNAFMTLIQYIIKKQDYELLQKVQGDLLSVRSSGMSLEGRVKEDEDKSKCC